MHKSVNNIMILNACIILLVGHGAFQNLYGQLESTPAFPEFRITISHRQFISLRQAKGSKLNLREATITINGNKARLTDLHLRGQTTLYFKRKSFSVALTDPIKINLDNSTVVIQKFDLLNLAMDKNLWHNRWSFLALSDLGIFRPFNSYCTVYLNDAPQGIYLLVEKPQAVAEDLKSPYMVRRGLDHKIEHEYLGTLSKEAHKEYKKLYYTLYNIRHLKAEALYLHLNNALNANAYFKWIGFNYFVKNGDYSDELFLYINPVTQRYEIIPWDYDDVFMDHPHEGKLLRNQTFRDRKIFSLEDDLDRTIVADDYVYGKYLTSLHGILLELDSTHLADITKKVREELEILGRIPTNYDNTLYLDLHKFNMEEANYDIDRAMQLLQNRRTALLAKL